MGIDIIDKDLKRITDARGCYRIVNEEKVRCPICHKYDCHAFAYDKEPGGYNIINLICTTTKEIIKHRCGKIKVWTR